MRIRGVVFDLDGTLVSQEIDFEAIRRELGLPPRTPLLEALDQLPVDERPRAMDVLARHEELAAATAKLHDGVAEFVTWLEGKAVRRAVLSRNSRRSVSAVLARVRLEFDPIVSRDDAPYKPSPHGLWQICKAWQVAPSEVLMIGDYIFDIQAGRSAGTRTALVTHGKQWPFVELADVTFPNFASLPCFPPEWFIDSP